MKLRSKLMAAMAAIAIATTTACSDDDNNGSLPSLDGTFQTIVTYEGSNDNGSSFTVTEPGTDVLTTFTSVKKFPTEGETALQPGTRVLIFYKNTADKRYQSGPIDLRGVSLIFTGEAQAKPQSEISPLRVDYMDVSLAELSGTYININARAAAGTPRVFDIYFDEATVASEFPQAFVVFETDSHSARERQLFGSFDIASVWDQSTCRGIRLTYMTDDGPESQTFNKGTQPIRPME